MSQPPFKAGDTVQLKSGGPIMTIHRIDVDDEYFEWQAECKWFDNKNEVCHESFAAAALVAAEAARGNPA